MEASRQIYWNIGHGWTTLVPMYLLTLAAIAILVYGFLQRLKVYKQGKPINRTDHFGERLTEAMTSVLMQTKVIRVRWPGLAHSLFFWGFLVLFIGTTLIVIQADFTDLLFGIKFLKGTFYKLFSVTLDIAGVVAIIMMGVMFVPRYLFCPKGLETSRDDAIMHGLIFCILVTGFVIEGAQMTVTDLGTPLSFWSPMGLVFGKAFSGMGEDNLRTLHAGTWWFHLLLVMLFIISIPYTKFGSSGLENTCFTESAIWRKL